MSAPVESSHQHFERDRSIARRRFQKGSLVFRNGRWYGRWWADEIKNGIRCRRYKWQLLGELPSKKSALRALQPFLDEVNSIHYQGIHFIRLRDFAKRWEQTVLTQLKASTGASYKAILNRHLVPSLGKQHLHELNPEIVQRFVTELAQKRSPKTVRNAIMVLRSLWKSAESWGYVSHNPFRGLRLPRLTRIERIPFTLEEIKRILENAPEPYRTYYWLAAETGLRAGELCGLRWNDVYEDSRLVRVRSSVWRGKSQSPKSANAARAVAISEALSRRLQALRELESQKPADALSTAPAFVFHTRRGTPWDQNLVVKRRLYPLLDELKIPRRGLHSFRHAQATFMDQLGVPMKIRQVRLGHSSAELTLDLYTHSVSSDEQLFAEKLGSLLIQ